MNQDKPQFPLSHVKVVDPNEKSYKSNRRNYAKATKAKWDAQGWSDEERKRNARMAEDEAMETAGSGKGGGYYKISSAANKPSEWHP